MLSAEPHGVAAAQASIEQDVQPNALARAYGPAEGIPFDIFVGPDREAGALLHRQQLDVGGRIDADMLGGGGPLEQAAHCLEEVVRLPRRSGATGDPGGDRRLGDLSNRRRAGRLDRLPEYILPLLA